ncbi:MAG: thioredoxin family protein [Chitinophagaceae bacterium]|nr:thioredoxin family protein [Chitinophagaceae bacterium]
MKKILFAVSLLLINILLFAQEQKPVQFRFEAKRFTDSTGSLIVHAKMEKGVSLFSMKQIGKDAVFVSSLKADTAKTIEFSNSDKIEENGKALSVSIDTIQYTTYPDSVSITIPFVLKNTSDSSISGHFIWLAKQADNYPSGEEKFYVNFPVTDNAQKAEADTKPEGFWQLFFICFLTGLLAVITPCVFPLIPVTVSFFLKKSKSRLEGIRNAIWYSLSIILIYTIPTIILVMIFGDDVLYQISTSPISNGLFFLIFLVFGMSFFGAFELQLPNSWANKADSQAGKGGLLGIFFMALTLVIVSFSCTGPLVGTLLGQTSSGGVSLAPIIGMLGFGAGLALPFSLFAFFPSMLQSLPKSGGWLNSVKVCFGFIELALALKFLSNIDLIYHWRLLDRDVFLVLWIVLFALMGVYLLGKLKFSHDSDLPHVSVPRLLFAVASFSFAMYLVPGLWGAPLRHLSGFLPPTGTQDFNLDLLKYSNSSSSISTNSKAKPPQRLTNKLHVPYNLIAYFTLEEGLAAAKILNKPIMIDFTGHSCANCRKMEQEVWKDPEVLRRMREDFVLVSLYVDESSELPQHEQYRKKDGDMVLSEGDRNLDYEITAFGFNAQPLYMFLDTNGKPLSNIKYGYDPDIAKFIAHLETVKKKFGN